VTDDRPKPEQFLSLIRQQQRGRLKVYLGFAPGVGKTYEMLQEGHRLKKHGEDVVVGIVETHGRAETAALAEGLESVTRRRVEYRGVALEEMDLDALLQRHPTVALVDELAHTNAPGSRHGKRYQDVEELLAAGVNVITTVNVQHLESLYDLIAGFTGVKVKERVPDYVVHQADQIVMVDLPAEDLQERLRAGKVYPPDRAVRALDHFFTEQNLSRLREIALEEIAQALDQRRQGRGPEPAASSDRVMVCLSSRGPSVQRLLRKAHRLARSLKAPWYAVYVQTPKERAEKIAAATHRRIADALALAHQLGGISMQYNGPDFASAVADFVRENGVTHVIVGRSRRPWYERWFRRSPLEKLLRDVPGVDVVVAGADEDGAPAG
jgi:two-component system, OmpR family, sensor histidine kinase KdpD